MNKKVIAFIALVAVALVALFVLSPKEDAPNQIETENIKQVVQDFSLGKRKDQSASITSHELTVTESNGSESTYDLSNEDFFVSIAPYIDQTHPWGNHNLTGCQGELVNEEFKVYIEDEDGNVVLDKEVQSHANGFIDLWLPREKNYTVKIEHNGKIVESTLSTFEGDNTCITTLQFT